MGCLKVGVSRRCGVGVDIERLVGIKAVVERRGGLDVAVSLICALNHTPYIRVKPTEVQWVDVGHDFDYSVFSNTDWVVN